MNFSSALSLSTAEPLRAVSVIMASAAPRPPVRSYEGFPDKHLCTAPDAE